MEFPSLLAASRVPCEDIGDDDNKDNVDSTDNLRKAAEEDQKRRESSLKPISKSGKLYNSFRAYKDIMNSSIPKVQTVQAEKNPPTATFEHLQQSNKVPDVSDKGNVGVSLNNYKSRVIGGVGISGQSSEVQDDGEGWVTSAQEIVAMKATGTLDPFGRNSKASNVNIQNKNLPPKSKRTACATTDFAMQNVILQMNLELLSVDGVKVRKLKSWVTRCAACFKIYTGSDNDGRRLFCERCGSSALQRIAASVDGNTGRLKLHLKKNYKSVTRGTQFALPKPGSQNKFMGDLLLAEDQLLYGAWNQRVKITRSKKEKQSIFGADIASNVGCHKDLTKRDDIKVGFGKKNPNATKFGRERRGIKKNSTDKACGVRRY
jgi:RNA-binding protein NOB1